MRTEQVTTQKALTAAEAKQIASDAYVYAFPLVLMDITRRVMTNVEAPDPRTMHAPMNQFLHVPAFPDPTFTDVVRPNADTLYSTMWFDVSGEPLVVHVPDSGGRYYLLPMLDLWTDVFAAPGKRTTGTGPQTFVLTGPGWRGTLPSEMAEIKAPTSVGWVIGRTQTNGKADYAAVHEFQAGIRVAPLSKWGTSEAPPRGAHDAKLDTSAPPDQVASMSAASFFTRFVELTKKNPPHPNDYPIAARMERLGIVPGRAFDPSKLPPVARAALDAAPAEALASIRAHAPHAGPVVNGWFMVGAPIGTYGTDYLKRALVALMGLGANLIEDACYPTAFKQADGAPFDSGAKYVVHFERGQLPPARAFWSLTMYDDRQLFTENAIDRYAIGDRDALKLNDDGSLDLYIQRDSPGADKESNWLPAPKRGSFSLTLRVYWPGPAMLEGTWSPPPVERV